MRTLLVFSILLFLFSCSKEIPVETPTNNNQSDLRTVKVTVKHIYKLDAPRQDSLVPGVEVKLFLSKQDRKANTGWDGIQTTDRNGEATFPARDDDYYYVRASHPRLGVKEAEVKTPPGTVNFLEIRYY
jgi:hypothetical protein